MTSSEMVKQILHQSEMEELNEPKQNSFLRRNRPGCSEKVELEIFH